ncbi:MAG TPA: transposase [Gemmata sp.]
MHGRAASGRQRYNVLGAINAVTHALVAEINTTYITATAVCASLHKIAALGGSVPVTLVLDNARSRRCALAQDAAKALGIDSWFLPSYSPNLNLIERFGKFVKEEVLNRRHHQDFKTFQGPSTGAWPTCRPSTERIWRPLWHTTSRPGTMCHSRARKAYVAAELERTVGGM